MTTLIDRLAEEAGTAPGRKAMTFLDASGKIQTTFTRLALADRVARIAGALREVGASDERVLLLLPSGPDFVTSFLGCLAAGAVAVPAYPPLPNRSAARIESIGNDCEPRFAIATDAEWVRLDKILDPEAPLSKVCRLTIQDLDAAGASLDPPLGSTAYLQYTSGSTRSPRGVNITHECLMHNHAMMRDAWEQNSNSVLVGWLPMFHDMGLIGVVLQSVFLGSHLVSMTPETFLMRPTTWLAAATDFDAHTIGGPNFAYELCTRKISDQDLTGLDLSGLHVAFNGAEPVRAPTLARFSERFEACDFRPSSFYPCYGLAEATLFVSGGLAGASSKVHDFSADSLETGLAQLAVGDDRVQTLVGVGNAWHDQRIAIVDPSSGFQLDDPRVGEIWLAGPSVADGYFRTDRLTGSFDSKIAGDVTDYLRTGDLGFVYRGELFIAGRLKDMIIIAGRNYFAEDIEHAADSSHLAVRPGRVAAFPLTVDEREVAVLVAELDRSVPQGTDLSEAIGALRSSVARHHDLALHTVTLVPTDAIPKTSSGKIQRSACRDLYLSEELSIVEQG